MTSLVFRLVLIILAVWILWQLLTIFRVKNGKGNSGKKSEPGKNMVKDPVCGMYMDPRLALKHETKTGIFYFCSEECKKSFLQVHSGEKSGAPSSKE